MKELKIGETITIKCVEGNEGCKGCTLGQFVPNADCADICCSIYRTDGKDVHFEIVED